MDGAFDGGEGTTESGIQDPETASMIQGSVSESESKVEALGEEKNVIQIHELNQ